MMNNIMGSDLKTLRLERGLSQTKLEHALGWGSGTVSRYEIGSIKIPKDRQKQLDEYFNSDSEKTNESTTLMGEAIKKAMTTKFTDHLPGEIWIHRRNSGQSLNKLILNIDGNMAYCITVFSNNVRSTDFKIKDRAGNTKYVGTDRLEGIRLKELEQRNGIISPKSFEDLKLHLAAIFGVAVIQKEIPVEKIVEVEKEVIKEIEIPVEKIVEVEKETSEMAILRREVEIYKDMVDRLLPPIRGGVRCE